VPIEEEEYIVDKRDQFCHVILYLQKTDSFILLRKTFAKQNCEMFVRERTIRLQPMPRSPDALPFGPE
jgi:hypothetical protein